MLVVSSFCASCLCSRDATRRMSMTELLLRSSVVATFTFNHGFTGLIWLIPSHRLVCGAGGADGCWCWRAAAKGEADARDGHRTALVAQRACGRV